MQNKKQDLIHKIMHFYYHSNWDAAWCKANDIAALVDREYQYSNEKEVHSQVLNSMDLLESRLKIIDIFIKNSYDWLPEDSLYGEFTDAEWKLDKETIHPVLIDQIIAYSLQYVNEEQKNNRDRLAQWLSNNGISKVYDAMHDPALKVGIDNYLEERDCDLKGRSLSDFEDYNLMKDLFLNQLFEPDQVQFFVLKKPKDEGSFPVVIGMDNQTIAVLWIDK